MVEGRIEHIRIKPFRGWRINASKAGDPSLCTSPPYDQFSSQLITQLEAQSPYNIARLIKAPEGDGPDLTGEHYRRARALLDTWVADGIITPDTEPGIYPYLQSYQSGSYEITRNGFIALGDLRDSHWFTHEDIHPQIREDRTRLRDATAADIGIIYMVYSDPEMQVDRLLRHCDFGSPIVVSSQPDGSTHRLYRCSQGSFIDRLTKQMEVFDCVVADGHHRLAAAIETWKQRENENWAYAMMAFLNADAPGMTVHPIHRLVARGPEWSFDKFLEKLADRFDVRDIAVSDLSVDAVARRLEGIIGERGARERIAFGLIGPDPNVAYTVETPKPTPSEWSWPTESNESYRQVATAIFDVGILRGAVGLTRPQIDAGMGLEFPMDADAVVERVRSGEFQLGFILPPTPLPSIFEVARQRQNLPQKSTFFFPKLLSGLVINRIAETNSP